MSGEPSTRTPPEVVGLIRLAVDRFARQLSRRFPQFFANGIAVSGKERVITWLRAALPPRPGRPRKATVTLAFTLRRKGAAWPEIYPRCIPGLHSLKWAERRRAIRRLRNAYRYRCRFMRRKRSKNPPSVSPAEKN